MKPLMRAAAPCGPSLQQRGFSLLEVAVVLVVVSLLSWATFGAYETVNNQRARELAQGTALQMQSTLRAFAMRHGRLPCPDTTGQGYETVSAGACTGIGQIGWFPYVSVGTSIPEDGMKARYAVFRNANGALAADADLAVTKERTGDTPGTATYQDVTDLIVALNNTAGATVSAHPYLTGDSGAAGAVDCAGNQVQSVAYWIVLPLKDRSGDGERLDAPHTTGSLCAASPSAPMRHDFDDVVLAESPSQLAGWLRKSLP